MNLEPAPRLSKSIFLIIDAVLLLTAFAIVYFNTKNPYAPLPFVSAVVCVVLAAVIGLIPFLIDYAADSAEYVQAERERVAEQVQRLHAAGESLARAAAQIKSVEEAVHKTAHAAETLPYRMQEKLAEFNQQLAQTEDEEKERLLEELESLRSSESERLQAVADKIHKAATDWAALEVATRKQLGAAEAALVKVQHATTEAAAKFETRVAAALATLDAKVAAQAALTAPPFRVTVTPEPAPVPVPAPEPVTAPAATPAPEPPTVVESVSVVESPAPGTPAPVVEEPKPKKPRAPRKPRTEEPAPAPEAAGSDDGEPAFNDTPAETAPAPAPSEEPPDLSAEAPPRPESSASSDGATRLLATAYIGIGNKLFIRGDGPGLSWDKGVPMQFVSIGKWGWSTADTGAAITCKLYKNDETAALTGEVLLEPGRHVEITALF